MYSSWCTGDSLVELPQIEDNSYGCVLADPMYEMSMINFTVKQARRISNGVSMVFMHLEHLALLDEAPERVYIWLKPPSPKPFRKFFSHFVECIAVYDVKAGPPPPDMYWTNHTGVFTDQLITQEHVYQKPDALIERLLRLHGKGPVLDPFAGSGVVARMATKLGFDSLSIDIDPKWGNHE